MRLRLIPLVAAVALGAVSLRAQQPGDAAGQADMREVMSYRLTDSTFAKLLRVQDNVYATMKANPDAAKKYEGALGAQASDAEPGIDGLVKAVDRITEVKQAIAKAGLTTRQYLLASMATMQAMMIDAMMQTYGSAQGGDLPAAVKENLAFLKTHQPQVDRMRSRGMEIDQLVRQARGEPTGDARPPAPPRGR